MVYCPVVPYYAEAYYKSEESKGVFSKIVPQGSVGKNMVVLGVRDSYLDYEQSDTNGKNSVTEKNKPFHLELSTRNVMSGLMHMVALELQKVYIIIEFKIYDSNSFAANSFVLPEQPLHD